MDGIELNKNQFAINYYNEIFKGENIFPRNNPLNYLKKIITIIWFAEF